MSIVLLGIPLAAVLAIILVAVGVQPVRVLALWAALVTVLSVSTLPF